MIQEIKYQGDGVYKDKPVMILSKDVGGLTLIGYFVRTDTVEKEEKDAS